MEACLTEKPQKIDCREKGEVSLKVIEIVEMIK